MGRHRGIQRGACWRAPLWAVWSATPRLYKLRRSFVLINTMMLRIKKSLDTRFRKCDEQERFGQNLAYSYVKYLAGTTFPIKAVVTSFSFWRCGNTTTFKLRRSFALYPKVMLRIKKALGTRLCECDEQERFGHDLTYRYAKYLAGYNFPHRSC